MHNHGDANTAHTRSHIEIRRLCNQTRNTSCAMKAVTYPELLPRTPNRHACVLLASCLFLHTCHVKETFQGFNLAHLSTVCLYVGPVYLHCIAISEQQMQIHVTNATTTYVTLQKEKETESIAS